MSRLVQPKPRNSINRRAGQRFGLQGRPSVPVPVPQPPNPCLALARQLTTPTRLRAARLSVSRPLSSILFRFQLRGAIRPAELLACSTAKLRAASPSQPTPRACCFSPAHQGPAANEKTTYRHSALHPVQTTATDFRLLRHPSWPLCSRPDRFSSLSLLAITLAASKGLRLLDS